MSLTTQKQKSMDTRERLEKKVKDDKRFLLGLLPIGGLMLVWAIAQSSIPFGVGSGYLIGGAWWIILDISHNRRWLKELKARE